MKYCSQCGGQISLRVPEGDRLERYICDSCDTIHYQNPRIITGTIPVHQGRVLLCRRAIEPRYGLWTLPAGFMENNETTLEGAVRETHEETLAEVTIDDLFAVFNIPHINQVYIMFRATLRHERYAPTDESLEVRLFDEYEIPWDRLAFPVIHKTLEYYFADNANGEFSTHVSDIHPKR